MSLNSFDKHVKRVTMAQGGLTVDNRPVDSLNAAEDAVEALRNRCHALQLRSIVDADAVSLILDMTYGVESEDHYIRAGRIALQYENLLTPTKNPAV